MSGILNFDQEPFIFRFIETWLARDDMSQMDDPADQDRFVTPVAVAILMISAIVWLLRLM